MSSAGRVAFGWVVCIAVIVTLAVMQLAVDPQIEMWQGILETYHIMPEVGDWLIGIYRLALLIAAVGITIYAVVNVLSEEDDTYGGYY